ncbi:MAG: Ig-like domain repeat protein [Aeromicrobium sp.]
MKTITSRRRGAAVVASVAVAASTLLGVPSAQAAAPPAAHGATVDYFDDVYTELGPNSVFETVTVERFEYLLKTKPGNFAFLIGDPKNSSTQATIGQINAEAKARGITKIYNFTPKLDGDTLNLWDLSQANLRTGVNPDPSGGDRTGSGLAQYQTIGDRLLTDYLNKDTQTQFTKNAATDPYLFVYNKDRTEGGAQDRIVAALAGATSASDLDTDTERTAYRQQVGSVLGSVTELATNTQFEFNRDEHNRRHYERSVKNANPTIEAENLVKFGGDILDAADNEDGFRIETITYPELKHIVTQSGDFSFLFGGTWCHNTAAIIKDTNRLAKEHGIKKVYNFDFSLSSTGNGGNDALHIRDNARIDPATGKVIRPSHLYGDLVNEYLTNAETQYRTTADQAALGGSVNAVQYYPGGDTTKPLKEARKIQVGHVLSYNKDRVDALGNRAPVVDQAIRQTDDGGNTEHMTEWWFVKGRNLAATAGDNTLVGSGNATSTAGADGIRNQRNFAKEGIDEIDAVLGGVADATDASTTTVTGLGGSGDAVPSVGATPAITVSVASPTYAPFISLNSASGGLVGGAVAPPSTATGKPRGLVGVFNGATQVGTTARLKRDGTASITLPPQTAGAKSYTVRYLGRGDAIAASSTPLQFTVAGDPSTTTLAAPAAQAFGAGGSVTATVGQSDATGSVSLSGLPGAPIVASLTGGTATFAIPATVPAGTHTLTATYLGDDKYGSSTSAKTLTVTKGNPSVTATAAGTTYGTAGAITVAATGPAGYVPTGPVRITVGGTTHTATLDAQGRATVAVPRALLPKAYAVTAVIDGDTNVRAASTTTTLTVAKGATQAPKFKTNGKVKASKKGKATVTVTTPAGLVKATGKVRVVLQKGSATKTITKTLSSGKVTVTLPKLKKGTYKVKITYLGDSTYRPSRTTSTKLVVKK